MPAIDTQPFLLRRRLLATAANPAPKPDYLVKLECAVADGPLRLAYVPDRLVLVPDGLKAYLAALAAEPWDAPEALGLALLADLNDQLVPRWLGVGLGHTAHRLWLEDRQPNWDNRALLDRLERF